MVNFGKPQCSPRLRVHPGHSYIDIYIPGTSLRIGWIAKVLKFTVYHNLWDMRWELYRYNTSTTNALAGTMEPQLNSTMETIHTCITNHVGAIVCRDGINSQGQADII